MTEDATTHRVETYPEGDLWGFQCLTCGYEATGYEDLEVAEDTADEHARMRGQT